MSIIKLQKQSINYTQVSNITLRDPQLTLKAKGLFSYLYSKPDNWDFNGDRICLESLDGRKSVYAGLKELENNGYIIRKKCPSGKMIYYIGIEPNAQKGQEGIEPNAHFGKVPKRQSAEKGSISNTDYINKTDKENKTECTPSQESDNFFKNEETQKKAIEYLITKGFNQNYALSEIKKFISYWTEPTKSGKKQRWETEKTYDVRRRLATWLNNSNKFNRSSLQIKRGIEV